MLIIGQHNFQNLNAAKNVCLNIGVKTEDFYLSINDFTGASNRLEKIFQSNRYIFYRDFAHSPSKVKATVNAVHEIYSQKIVSIYELHTFSSFNKSFLKEYKNTLVNSDIAVLYYDQKNISNKGVSDFNDNYIKECFNRSDLIVINEKKKLTDYIQRISELKFVLLMMSSGNFSGLTNKEIKNYLE